MKTLATFAMRGFSQSVMATSVLAMLSLPFPLIGFLISLLSTACVGLVVLRHGARAGAMTAGASTLVCGLLMAMIFGNPLPALGFLLMQWLPVGMLGQLLRSSRSLVRTTQAGLGFGLLAVVVQYVSLGDPNTFWAEQLKPMAQNFVDAGLFDQTQSVEMVSQLAGVMCGVLAAGILLQLLFSLYLARWWQALLYNPGGFAAEFHQLRLYKLVALPGAIILLLWLLPGIALPAAVSCLGALFLSLFLLQGLAVAHGVFGGMKNPQRWLVVTYLMLFVFMPQMFLALAIIGLLDVWIDFRVRFLRQQGGG
jgi:hypothetical protein